MSRFRRFAHSVVSGYALLGANIVSTFATVPLALHYLSKVEFGLWALVTQVSGYLVLIDLGMTSSVSRILIDHKDNPNDGVYGAVLKTSALVLAVQGAIIGFAGFLVSFWVPALFKVPIERHHDFQVLVAAQCVIMGLLFAGRLGTIVLHAHQRYDLTNYSQMGGLILNFGLIWFGFAVGWGLYSLLIAYAANAVFGVLFTLAAVLRLRLLPSRGSWGRASMSAFRELFAYGRELFLISVGIQLISASQVMVISRTLGLDAAAVWSIATKPFMLAQQFVYRLFDFSASGLAEMMVRKERDRLLARFRDLVILSASLSVWIALAVALCNHGFLALWTKGRISWSPSSDWLMAVLVIVNSTLRCSLGFAGLTKQIRSMKYVYLLEGVSFVTLSLLTVPIWGVNGIIVCAIVTNLLCTGAYGIWRTKRYFEIQHAHTMLAWLRWPALCLVSLAAFVAVLRWIDGGWNTTARFSMNAAAAALVGFVLFWRFGLSPQLRLEAAGLFVKLRGRLRV